MNLSVVVNPTDPDNPDVSDAWATPVLGIVYFVLVVVALASLMASNWIPAPSQVSDCRRDPCVAVCRLRSPDCLFPSSAPWAHATVQKLVVGPVELGREIGRNMVISEARLAGRSQGSHSLRDIPRLWIWLPGHGQGHTGVADGRACDRFGHEQPPMDCLDRPSRRGCINNPGSNCS